MKYTEDDITNNMGLVFTMARRLPNLLNSGIMEFSDVISEGVLGLVHALERFDPDRGFKFSSYACRCISGFMLRGHRNLHMEQWKAKNSRYDVPSTTIPMFQPYFDSDEVKEVVGCDDRGMNARTMFNELHNKKIWEQVLPVLTPRQRQVIELLLSGLTQTEIAPQLGVTRQCVSQTMQLAVENAKKHFAQERKAA